MARHAVPGSIGSRAITVVRWLTFRAETTWRWPWYPGAAIQKHKAARVGNTCCRLSAALKQGGEPIMLSPMQQRRRACPERAEGFLTALGMTGFARQANNQAPWAPFCRPPRVPLRSTPGLSSAAPAGAEYVAPSFHHPHARTLGLCHKVLVGSTTGRKSNWPAPDCMAPARGLCQPVLPV
jgi:hypothetical protein